MSDSNSSVKTAVIVAIIGLFGTIATVVITNWDKLFRPNMATNEQSRVEAGKKESSTTNINERVSTETSKPSINYQLLAESIVANYLAAFKSRDINSLVAMSSIPFYNDHDILITLSDVRDRFDKNFAAKSPESFPIIKSIKVKTVGEWKNEGLVSANDRILGNLNIPDDSYFGVAEFEHDALVLVFRKIGNDLKVAGIWD